MTTAIVLLAAAAALAVALGRREAFDPAAPAAPWAGQSWVQVHAPPGSWRLPATAQEVLLLNTLQTVVWALGAHLLRRNPRHPMVLRLKQRSRFLVALAPRADAPAMQAAGGCIVVNPTHPSVDADKDDADASVPLADREADNAAFLATLMVRAMAETWAPQGTVQHDEAFAWFANEASLGLGLRLPPAPPAT